MQVEIYNQTKAFRGSKKLTQWVSRVLKEVQTLKVWPNPNPTSLQIIVVAEKTGRLLNHQFRKKNYATDVLSFAPNEPGSLGEIVICWPVICKQAKEEGQLLTQGTRQEALRRGWSIEKELNYMVLHGVLHLLGYDHEKSDKDARAMYRLQDDIFIRLQASQHKKTLRKNARPKSKSKISTRNLRKK